MKKVQKKLEYWNVSDLVRVLDTTPDKNTYNLLGECVLEGYKKPTQIFLKNDTIYILDKSEYKSVSQLKGKIKQALLSWIYQVNPVGAFLIN